MSGRKYRVTRRFLLGLVGVLVSLSAFVMLYRSYRARGYLQFLGLQAKQGTLKEEYLPLWAGRKRIKNWWRSVWLCPWIKRPVIFLSRGAPAVPFYIHVDNKSFAFSERSEQAAPLLGAHLVRGNPCRDLYRIGMVPGKGRPKYLMDEPHFAECVREFHWLEGRCNEPITECSGPEKEVKSWEEVQS